MECNKDEALRAKEMAEKKMENNDFEGALKIALKARGLFPELENINQLIMVCNVHCAAQIRILGTEKDFYKILQLEKFADETTIRKQFRKLALVLHPDKNKLPGAEAAFKLIGEANVMLLDPAKRLVYDSKCRVSVKNVPSRPAAQVNRNAPSSKSFGTQSSFPNGVAPQFANLNNHQTTSNSSVSLETFWTYCPFCNTKYQYQKRFVNNPLRCQRCSKPFIAYDIGTQGMPAGFRSGQPGPQPKSYWNPPVASQPKDIPPPGKSTTNPTSAAGVSASQGKATQAVKSESGGKGKNIPDGGKMKTTEKDDKNGGGMKTSEKDDKNTNAAGGRNKGTVKVDIGKPKDSQEVSNKGKKRGRKQVVESSESCDTSSIDTDEVEENGVNYSAGLEPGVNGVHQSRRSSRHKQNVSYSDNRSDDDKFDSPPKKSHKGKAPGDGIEVGKEAAAAAADDIKANPEQGGSNYPAGSSQMGKKKQVAGSMGIDADKVQVIDDSDSEDHADKSPDPQFYDCPDPEFTDFDKDKEESCFAVDQVWALYDTVDGMPRFYAQIKKVFKPGFRLRMTWLEADPQGDAETDWVENELPFGCGRYERGHNEDTTDCLTFSHQMQCVKATKGSYVIYPRKGEIWAIFHCWDIKWSSGSENDRKYKYELVEVVSDFVEDSGIRVAYLDKVKGFLCLFHRTSSGEGDSFLIPPSELLRFSHRIPSCKMNGTEKKGVPVGSFELDPASLPSNPEDICYPCKDGNRSSLDAGFGSPKRQAGVKGNKGPNAEEFSRRRSPRGVKA